MKNVIASKNKLHATRKVSKFVKAGSKFSYSISMLSLIASFSGCTPPSPRNISVPSIEYANRLKRDYAASNPEYRASFAGDLGTRSPSFGSVANSAAALRLANDGAAQGALPLDKMGRQLEDLPSNNQVVSNMGPAFADSGPNGYVVQESQQPNIRDYTGPLSLGEPGVSSSLWRETRGLNLVRDVRAFQAMDLITIVVQETAEGKREADTDIKESSSISASISSLLGIDDTIIKSNPQLKSGDNQDLKDIIGAEFQSDFKGEGETTRKGSLKGRISAMVVEVLPSGVLRVEGEKILAVNNEDEIMVISGLIRPEDVSSNNEVSSSRLANMRIDYFGQGTVGDAQVGGWFSRVLRRLWPL